jgi:C-terminal processing protease CtpA/Prc
MAKLYLPARAVRAADKAVRHLLKETKPLHEFLAGAQVLDDEERLQIVDQAIMLLEDFYVHLPLKRAMYAIDPVRRLRLLRHRLPQFKTDRQFHAEITDIFTSLRDAHTNYLLPQPFTTAYAWLPFKVEACMERGVRQYIVSRTVDWFADWFPDHPSFREGVEIKYWDGIPIERAIEIAATQNGGANSAARRALGIAGLTYRWLGLSPPPDAEWVNVTYQTPVNKKSSKKQSQKPETIRFDWVVTNLPPSPVEPRAVSPEIEQLRRLRSFLFAADPDPKNPFRVETVEGKFGYIRIFTFEVDDADKLVATFKKHVKRFRNTKGLIVDVRDNGGGRTKAGERLIQLIAPAKPPIAPELLYFINTPRTLEFCRLGEAVRVLGPKGLQPWIDSIERSMQTGAMFSAGFPYTNPKACNDMGRIYDGPVIVITNALSYSATEFFAAGFQDHGGKILGVDETTGGGGAGVRSYRELRGYFKHKPPFEEDLPKEAGMTVAFRRSVRVGLHDGKDVEDFGVTPDYIHVMTRNDLLNREKKNADLKKHAARLLAKLATVQRGDRRPKKPKSASSRITKRRSRRH